MALIKRLSAKDMSCYIIKTKEKNFLFDYPAELYGKNHRYYKFGDTNKDVKFVIPSLEYEDIDSIFISRSDSLGICFLENFKGKIYMSEPVYEQLLLKIEEIEHYSVYYDEEEVLPNKKIVTLKNLNKELLKTRVKTIKFNEHIYINNILIECISANTFIGWTNYSIFFISGSNRNACKSIIYLGSISFNRRFSIDSPKLNADFVIINRKEESKKGGLYYGTDIITTHIGNFIRQKNVIIIPVEMQTFFIEFIFHIFYFLSKKELSIDIFVISRIFKKLSTIVNIQSEWINNTFQQAVYSGNEPFSFKSYKKLQQFDDFSSIQDICTPSIIFCSETEFSFLKNSTNVIFENEAIISINSESGKYRIKLEAEIDEIREMSPISTFIGSIKNEAVKFLNINENYCFNENNECEDVCIENIDKINITYKDRICEFLLDGSFLYSDKDSKDNCLLTLKGEGDLLRDLFRERYFYFDGCYFFPSKKLKIKIEDDDISVIKY